jgi:hypothetical protein
VLLLPALVAALLSGTVFWLLRDRLALPAAFLSGGLLLLTPPLLWSNEMIMVDTAFTLLCFWTGLAFAKWVDTESAGAAVLTGVLAALSLLTKVNSIYLILLAPLVFLVRRRWRLLLRGTFWIIPAIVAAAWGPWMLYTRKLTVVGFGGLARPDVFHISVSLGRVLWENLGWLLIPILAGGVIVLRQARFNTSELVCVLLPLSYMLFLLAARVDVESRFLVPVAAPSMVLAGIALGAFSERLARKGMPANWIATVLASGMLIVLAATFGRQFLRPAKNQVRPVVEFLRARGGPEASVLVPTEAEGPFMAELASDEERRPLRFMIRPNKLLATVDWNAGFYESRYRTPEEMVPLFDRLPVRYTVIKAQPDSRTQGHDRLLRTMLDAHPERWRRLDAPAGPWLVYERIDGRGVDAAQTAAILRQYLTDRLLVLSPATAARP